MKWLTSILCFLRVHWCDYEQTNPAKGIMATFKIKARCRWCHARWHAHVRPGLGATINWRPGPAPEDES